MAVKEGEAIDKLVRLREAICIFTDLTKKEASKDEQRSKLLFDTVNQVKQELNAIVILSVFSSLWRDAPLVIIKGRLYAVLLTLPMKYISYH